MRQGPLTEIFQKIDQCAQDGSIPVRYGAHLKTFLAGYEEAIHADESLFGSYTQLFLTFVRLIQEQCIEPHAFQPYHESVRSPFDYYRFGLDMIRPLIDQSRSSLHGEDRLKEIADALDKGDNVIFLANHQTESDPLVISILLQQVYPKMAEKMIFVAGERVITDPLAIPFSMGRNLLCIYSKRYIDHPPENKLKKQLHNKRTMELMSQLLSEGGKAIYVAPSGGRDRPNAAGVFEVANYDPQSIQMFYLMSQRSKHPTHFYPMALKTHELLPPPETIRIELGEERFTKRAGVHLAFGPRVDMEHFPGSAGLDKHSLRSLRAEYICNLVRQDYVKFP